MKNSLLLLLSSISLLSFGQSWNFVGTESFTPPYCSSAQIANFGPALTLIVDPYDYPNSTNYLHPYQFDGTDWNIYLDSIHHPIFSTYDLMQDIEMNSTNEHFIMCFAGPNKTYLYQSDLGNQEWDLVDSFMVNCDDLEMGSGGNVWVSGYGGIFEHQWGLGTHNTFTSPQTFGNTKMTMNDLGEPVFIHAGPSNSVEVSDNNGAPFNELDSLNYGTGTWGYDVGMSEDKVVTVHLDPLTQEIVLKKQNGVSWDVLAVNPGTTYSASEVKFNLTENPLDGTIYLAVHEAAFGGGSTVMDITVYEISADLLTTTSLGSAVNFTIPMTALPLNYDLEFDNNKVYCSYVNATDSSKASVKSYDVSTVSVKEEASLNFRIFPNPANATININTDLANYNYNILDVTGKLVVTGQASYQKSIDVTSLQNGIYFVQISDGTQVSRTKKLIIQ